MEFDFFHFWIRYNRFPRIKRLKTVRKEIGRNANFDYKGLNYY